ncbi:hypothetical protein ACQJBY_027438 [Aegilops geniculata]
MCLIPRGLGSSPNPASAVVSCHLQQMRPHGSDGCSRGGGRAASGSSFFLKHGHLQPPSTAATHRIWWMLTRGSGAAQAGSFILEHGASTTASFPSFPLPFPSRTPMSLSTVTDATVVHHQSGHRAPMAARVKFSWQFE